MFVDNYLKNHDKTIEDITRQVDYSPRQIENMAVITYPDDLLEALSEVTDKTITTILFELLMLENPGKVADVTSKELLADAVQNQKAYIYIEDSVRTESSRLVNSVVSEKDTMGVELGSKGTVNILGEIIYQFQKMFDKDEKEFKDLKSKLRTYRVKLHGDRGSIIYRAEEMY